LSEVTAIIGRQTFLDTVSLAAQTDDPCATAFWQTYQSISVADQRDLPFDEIALAAGVPAHELLGAAVRAAMRFGVPTGEMVYAAMAPRVVRQMMTSAMRIGGPDARGAMLDRHKVLQHSAFLPAPHRQTIIVDAPSTADAKSATAAVANADASVPSFLEDMASLDDVKREVQRQLIAHAPGRVVDGDR
jgi:hypothetical protein